MWLLLSKHITETEEKSTDYIALHVFDIEKLRQDPDYTYAVDSTPTTPIAAKAGTPSHQRSLSTPQEVAKRKGTRIYYEDGSIHKGSYVNSQHILVRLDAPVGQNEYTIVLSQNFKTRDLYFTLRVFATCEFNIRTMPNKYNIKKEVRQHDDSIIMDVAADKADKPTLLHLLISSFIRLKVNGQKRPLEGTSAAPDT